MDKAFEYHLETLALHAGQQVDSDTLSRAVPIYQTTSYVFKDSDHAANLFALKEFGNIYTRLMNPTTDVLEKRLAALEGGAGGLALSSGQSAIYVSIFNICCAGGHIVSSNSLYGGTVTLFSQTFPKLGIEVTFVDPKEPDNFAKAIKNNTRLIYIETIGNPKNDILQYEKIADIAHKNGMPVICDNTVTTPILFRPIDYGIDIVVHSCTKFIGGHGTCIGGAIVDSGKFDWTNGRYPELTEPDPSYHGVKYVESFWRTCIHHKGPHTIPCAIWAPVCHRSTPSCSCRGWRPCICACPDIPKTPSNSPNGSRNRTPSPGSTTPD